MYIHRILFLHLLSVDILAIVDNAALSTFIESLSQDLCVMYFWSVFRCGVSEILWVCIPRYDSEVFGIFFWV